MVTLLTGKKGSGKTKQLIQLANAAIESSKGCVVVIEKGLKLTYDISHKARLVDADAYDIKSADALFGFVSGICAGNFDVTDILVDSTMKIINGEASALEAFIREIKRLSETDKVNFVLSVSMANEEVPEPLREFVMK